MKIFKWLIHIYVTFKYYTLLFLGSRLCSLIRTQSSILNLSCLKSDPSDVKPINIIYCEVVLSSNLDWLFVMVLLWFDSNIVVHLWNVPNLYLFVKTLSCNRLSCQLDNFNANLNDLAQRIHKDTVNIRFIFLHV